MKTHPFDLCCALKRIADLFARRRFAGPAAGLALAINAVLVSPAWGQAGQVLSAIGEVQIRRASGQAIPGLADLSIGEGDTILTGPGSEVQLRMVDDARLTVRANTQIKVQAYRYEGREDGNERGIISLLHGALRSITGAIGRTNKDKLLLHTPTATIGIRGTDHESAYIPQGDSARPGVEPGTYDMVTSGETYIEAHGQRVELAPEQAGFAGLDPRVAPVRLREVPSFLRGGSRHGDTGRKGEHEDEGDKQREKNRDKDRDARKEDTRNGEADRAQEKDRRPEGDSAKDSARERERDVRKDREIRDERRDRTERTDRSERRDRVRSRDD